MKNYLCNIMNKYMNNFYIPKINNSQHIDCSICLENIDLNNFGYCNYCNNYFHNKCYYGLMNDCINKKCALCRKDMYKHSIGNNEFKYNLFKKVIENIV